MTINELRTKRAALWGTMEGFLDTHRNEKGVLSAEDDAVYTGMEKDLDDLTNEINWIADREGRSFKRLDELFAATGQVGFRGSERVDGKLILPEAVKVLRQKA